ncbi:MAG: hypothetical protein MOGMAGMI_00415 [Candidatus Omnitrophica bacterium]|nr:hypothetical protein [Candidatus Omnitrophota bacterium]
MTLAALGAAVAFRLYPVQVFPRLIAVNKAELTVYTWVRRNVERHLSRTYPHAGPDEMRALRAREFERFVRENRRNIRDRIRAVAAERLVTERQKPFYLMEADPYHYLSLTRDLLERGQMAASWRGREFLNPMTLAPVGAWYPADLHPYLGAALYKIVAAVMPGDAVPLEAVLGSLPILLACLCALPYFLLAKNALRLRVAAYGVGLLHLLLGYKFLVRSLVGWYDTDGYNVLFPLFAMTCVLLWLRDEARPETGRISRRPQGSFWLGLAVGVTLIHSLFWRGWALSHLLLSLSALTGLVLTRLSGPSERRSSGWAAWTASVLLPLAVAPLLWGPEAFRAFVAEIGDFYKEFLTPSVRLWPDVFLTVGELKRAGWKGLSASAGGATLYLAALTGIVWTLMTRDAARRAAAAGVLGLFCAASVAGALLDRFTLFIVAPAAMGTGLLLERVCASVLDPARRRPGSWRHFWAWVLVLAVGGGLIGAVVRQAHRGVRYEHPIYDRGWDSMMEVIRTRTPAESIIACWWPPGHFITSMGRRKVLFDGATQNTPQAYWVAAFFLEPSEKRSLALLRMLARGSNNALEELQASGLPISAGIRLIKDALTLSPDEALERYRASVGPERAARVLEATHGQTCPVYVLVYEEMARDALALEYVGNWNHAAAERLDRYAKENPGKVSPRLLRRASKENLSLIWFLSRPPYAQGEESFEDHRSGRTVFFPNGVTLDLDSLEAQIDSKSFGRGRPRHLYLVRDGRLVRRPAPGAELRVSVLLIEQPSAAGAPPKYSTVIADERLIESMVFRLFYLRGAGLNGYKLIAGREDADSGRRLYLYEADLSYGQGSDPA